MPRRNIDRHNESQHNAAEVFDPGVVSPFVRTAQTQFFTEVEDRDGTVLAKLPLWSNPSNEETANSINTISFEYPEANENAQFVVFPNVIALYEQKGNFTTLVEKYFIGKTKKRRGDVSTIQVAGNSLIFALTEEKIFTGDNGYSTFGPTPAWDVVKDLLDTYQLATGSQRISLAFMSPSIRETLVDIRLQEGASILSGIKTVLKVTGGRLQIDPDDRHMTIRAKRFAPADFWIFAGRDMPLFEISTDPTKIKTHLYIYGAGTSPETRLQPADGNPIIASTAGEFGVLPIPVVQPQIDDADELQRFGEALIERIGVPRIEYALQVIDLTRTDDGGLTFDFDVGKLAVDVDVRLSDQFLTPAVDIATTIIWLRRDLERPTRVQIRVANPDQGDFRGPDSSATGLSLEVAIAELYRRLDEQLMGDLGVVDTMISKMTCPDASLDVVLADDGLSMTVEPGGERRLLEEFPFQVRIFAPDKYFDDFEIMTLSSVAQNVFTIDSRADEGTTAAEWPKGTLLRIFTKPIPTICSTAKKDEIVATILRKMEECPQANLENSITDVDVSFEVGVNDEKELPDDDDAPFDVRLYEAGAPINEKQAVAVDAAGGTFSLTFEGQITTALPFNVTRKAMGEALEALSNVDQVVVTGGQGNVGGTKPYLVEFQGVNRGKDVGSMVSNASLLTGGAGTAVVTVKEEGKGGYDVGYEIGTVTAVAGQIYTVTRAQEGTTAKAWAVATRVKEFTKPRPVICDVMTTTVPTAGGVSKFVRALSDAMGIPVALLDDIATWDEANDVGTFITKLLDVLGSESPGTGNIFGVPVAVGDANAEGTGSQLVRRTHVHQGNPLQSFFRSATLAGLPNLASEFDGVSGFVFSDGENNGPYRRVFGAWLPDVVVYPTLDAAAHIGSVSMIAGISNRKLEFIGNAWRKDVQVTPPT